jgi:hypothetical protein
MGRLPAKVAQNQYFVTYIGVARNPQRAGFRRERGLKAVATDRKSDGTVYIWRPSMIRKSGSRFSEMIMLQQNAGAPIASM